MTNWISNIPIKYAIKQSISEKIKEACDRHFKNYTIQNEVFIVKNQHKISNFPLHQDWSFVDENQYKTINIWIALQDTSAKNGGLYVIKGSHHLKNKIRGAGKLSLDFDHYKKKLNPYLTQLHLKKGQAVFFYHSLIHGSPSNSTNEPRKIISLSVLPINAKNIINQYDEISDTLFQYEVNADFSFEFEDIRAKKPFKNPYWNTCKCYT
ncbi:MAG: phytanoyl-CoA dioxygenase family protein [Bacteroidetes bacterium]|nr:phytanoyl-CoA dioxygenase family protein [Bacteroidota bacterium]